MVYKKRFSAVQQQIIPCEHYTITNILRVKERKLIHVKIFTRSFNFHYYVQICFRRDEMVFKRCKIGHERLTYSHFVEKEEEPYSISYIEYLTARYMLNDCTDLG